MEAWGGGQKGGANRCFPLPPQSPSPPPSHPTLPSAQKEPRSRSLREEPPGLSGAWGGVACGRGYGSSVHGKAEAAPSSDPSWRVSGRGHAKQWADRQNLARPPPPRPTKTRVHGQERHQLSRAEMGPVQIHTQEENPDGPHPDRRKAPPPHCPLHRLPTDLTAWHKSSSPPQICISQAQC